MFSLIKRLYNKRYTQPEVELTKLPKIALNSRPRLPALRNWMVPIRLSSIEFCSLVATGVLSNRYKENEK